MPTTYGGTNAFPASSQLPSDGDRKPVVSIIAALQALFNRTFKLSKDLDGTNHNTVTVYGPNLTGNGQVLGTLAARVNGFFCDRPWVETADAATDTTFTLLDGDIFIINDLSGSKTYKMGSTGVIGGKTVRWFIEMSSFDVTLKRSDGTTICVLSKVTTGAFPWVDIMTNGASNDWRVVGGNELP